MVRTGQQLAVDMAGSAVGAVVGLLMGGSAGAVMGAATGPAASQALAEPLYGFLARRAERPAAVVRKAAERAGITPEELIARLEADPAREEMLIKALKAAQDSALDGKLLLLAQSLGEVASSEDADVIGETAFVRALDECDVAHCAVLVTFTRTANEIGLGNGSSDFDAPAMGSLNYAQLGRVLPALAPLLDQLLGTLQRHGLVRERSSGGGMSFSGGYSAGNLSLWEITPLGQTFVARLESLAGHGRS